MFSLACCSTGPPEGTVDQSAGVKTLIREGTEFENLTFIEFQLVEALFQKHLTASDVDSGGIKPLIIKPLITSDKSGQHT